jgi:hypothetical protein
MNHEPTPAIVRTFGQTDSEAEVISTPYHGISNEPGMGDSGYKVQVVEHDCPSCSFDRMIRRVDVSPETQAEVRYWCLSPNCVHYVSDYMSHACHGSYPQRKAQEPAVYGAP